MTKPPATLVSSSERTLAWLGSLRDQLPEVGYSESRHWAAFRDPVGGTAIAYVNVNKGSMRLFVRLQPEEHTSLVETPSSSSWAKRFPAVFRISSKADIGLAAQLVALSGENCIESALVLHAEAADHTATELDAAIIDERLRLGCVPTDTDLACVRQRRGQDRVRRLSLENYGNRCALCDVSTPELLVASHIVGWAEDPEARGLLVNVLCLCIFHDALFEEGFWSLSDSLDVVVRSQIKSRTIRSLLKDASFRRPQRHPPRPKFLRHHRNRVGL